MRGHVRQTNGRRTWHQFSKYSNSGYSWLSGLRCRCLQKDQGMWYETRNIDTGCAAADPQHATHKPHAHVSQQHAAAAAASQPGSYRFGHL
jgi:hypothetical protein